jgi:Uma2 family endonuclease
MLTHDRTHPTTADQFDVWALLPENLPHAYEFIAGKVAPVVSNNRASVIAMRIAGRLQLFIEADRLGFLTGSDGGYRIGRERYIPDVAFVRAERLAAPTDDAYLPIAPDLVVEVLSPGNTPDEIAAKLTHYLAAGCVVWLVEPDAERVTVHQPDQPAQALTVGDTLSGSPVLPEFSLPVSVIFGR